MGPAESPRDGWPASHATIGRSSSAAWISGLGRSVASLAVQKPLVLVGVAFALFFLISEPQALASLVLSILHILRGFGDSIVTFVRDLF